MKRAEQGPAMEPPGGGLEKASLRGSFEGLTSQKWEETSQAEPGSVQRPRGCNTLEEQY